jgi:hypothetical protein
MELYAYYNAGRWLVKCPDCDNPHYAELEKAFVCQVCYPGLNATALQQHTNRLGQTLFRPVPDLEAREDALTAAAEAGKVFTVNFPAERLEIERLTRKRPVKCANWKPGETIELLQAENDAMGWEA